MGWLALWLSLAEFAELGYTELLLGYSQLSELIKKKREKERGRERDRKREKRREKERKEQI